MRLSVIIAAHNEAGTIAGCLEKVLAQEDANFKVIVANDRSTDETGDIVRAMIARHPNLHCIDITELPAGWSGKTHAVTTAAATADGEYLVFTDSDVDWHPRVLATMISLVTRHGFDFLSLYTRIIVGSFWERLLMPACGWVLVLWFHTSPPWGRQTAPVYANGQFLMIRRQAYEKIGGHASVADAIIEDVPLAKKAHAAGLKCHVALAGDLIQTRMYENLRQILSGWTRLYVGALGSRWRIMAGMVTVSVGSLLPLAVLAAIMVWIMVGGSMDVLQWSWLTVALLQLVGMYSVVGRVLPESFSGHIYIWPFPIALFVAVILLAKAFLLMCGLGTISWGGVRYKVHGCRVVTARPGGL
jgi:glycosyltransferase involved in cell wall biosynthesis